jgi:polysaccharide pyruvyl transferase CsaB
MNKVVLSGYYGFNNAGDEAVLQAIINSLKKADQDLYITVLSNNPEHTTKAYGVKAVNRWKLNEIAGAIKESDLLISGGGSLLQDVTSKNGILYYLGIIGLARFYKKPVVIYSQGIGPVNTKRNRWLVAKTLNKTQGITVRDEQSKEELLKMGVKKEIIVSADPVLGFNPDDTSITKGLELLERGGVKLDDKGKILGVSLRPWKADAANFQAIAQACDKLIERGWQIVFIPMHFPEDIAVAREFTKGMKREAQILKENYSPTETLDLYKTVDLVLGMRLHALIMAAVVEKPLVPISYDPKVDSFMKLLDIDNSLQINNLHTQELINSIETTWKNKEKIVQDLKEKTVILRQQAIKPTEMVMELLTAVSGKNLMT